MRIDATDHVEPASLALQTMLLKIAWLHVPALPPGKDENCNLAMSISLATTPACDQRRNRNGRFASPTLSARAFTSRRPSLPIDVPSTESDAP